MDDVWAEGSHVGLDLILNALRVQHSDSGRRATSKIAIAPPEQLDLVSVTHQVQLLLNAAVFTAACTVEAVGYQHAHGLAPGS